MNAKTQMLEILEMIKNIELNKEVLLNNPSFKFKIALKEKMLSEEIPEETISLFLKVFKVDINEYFVNDTELMESSTEAFCIALKKLIVVSEEAKVSLSEVIDLMGEGLSLSFN